MTCRLLTAGTSAASAASAATGNTPNFGPNVYVFTTSMSTTTIQDDINQVYATQQSRSTPRSSRTSSAPSAMS
ncbi:MAG: hypothetical protein ACRDRJ_15930 [Streptosporangiaceae bacterium]